MAFFETIYSWFHSYYNDILWNTVKQIVNEDETVLFADGFFIIGIITLVLSLLVAVAYYVWPINHPRFKAWWSWLIMLIVAALMNFGVGIGFAHSRIQSVKSNDEACTLVIGDDYDGEALDEHIDFNDYLGFGLSNFFVGSIFFVICSIPLTFYNGNARFSPFRK